MNHNPLPPDDSWESDAVWRLLDQSPMKTASARFAADTVCLARLAVDDAPWWSRLFAPAPIAGLAGVTAALSFAAFFWLGPMSESDAPLAALQSAQADANLAQANLARAQALVGRGFISKADIDQRTAARDGHPGTVSTSLATRPFSNDAGVHRSIAGFGA